jgi:hypothetical protein
MTGCVRHEIHFQIDDNQIPAYASDLAGYAAEASKMLNYEIRYLTSDDRLALIYNTLLSGDRDAVRVAMRPMRLRYKQFEIWRGDECVEKGVNPELPN